MISKLDNAEELLLACGITSDTANLHNFFSSLGITCYMNIMDNSLLRGVYLEHYTILHFFYNENDEHPVGNDKDRTIFLLSSSESNAQLMCLLDIEIEQLRKLLKERMTLGAFV